MDYLRTLPGAMAVLWCYLIWYLTMVVRYFEPNPSLWFTSLGLALIVGVALTLSTGPLSLERWRTQRWVMLRLFLIPFCVSSFAALVKGKGFTLIFSPHWHENATALAFCVLFLSLWQFVRRSY